MDQIMIIINYEKRSNKTLNKWQQK